MTLELNSLDLLREAGIAGKRQLRGRNGIAAGISGACMSCHDGTIAMDVVTNVNGLAFGTAPTGGNVAFTAGPNKKATYSNGTGGSANVMSGGLPFLGSDLRNDHPVAIVYQTALTADPGHYTPITQVGAKIYVNGSGGQLPLYGTSTANATVECASCHDAHNNSLNGTNGGFLRQANTGGPPLWRDSPVPLPGWCGGDQGAVE